MTFPLWRTVKTMIIPNPQNLSPQEQSNINELETKISKLRDNSYKFADVLFKSVSWLLLIGVVFGLWSATRYFVFIALAGTMIGAFIFFLFMRLLYPLTRVLSFFQQRKTYYGTWATVIFGSAFIIVPMITVNLVVPVAVKKATFALHCFSINSDLARRPADCPARPKRGGPALSRPAPTQ